MVTVVFLLSFKDFQDWRRQSSTSSCDFHPQHVERPAVGSPTKVSLAALEGQGNPHVPGFSVSASQFHCTDQEAQRDEAGESQVRNEMSFV